MREEINFSGIHGTLEIATPSSARYTLLSPDTAHGQEVIGSLDVHYPCNDRGSFSATIALDSEFEFTATPKDIATILPESLGLQTAGLWDILIWRVSGGQVEDNDPKKFRR